MLPEKLKIFLKIFQLIFQSNKQISKSNTENNKDKNTYVTLDFIAIIIPFLETLKCKIKSI